MYIYIYIYIIYFMFGAEFSRTCDLQMYFLKSVRTKDPNNPI